MESRKEPNKDQEDDERMDQSAPVKPPEEVVGRTEESQEGMELGGPPTPLEEVGDEPKEIRKAIKVKCVRASLEARLQASQMLLMLRWRMLNRS